MPDSLDQRHTTDLTGRRFGRLRVIQFAGYRLARNGQRQAWWEVVCEGNGQGDDHPKPIFLPASRLISGNTKSCGCLKADVHRSRHEAVRQGYIGRSQNHRDTRLLVIGIEKVGTAGNQTILRCLCHCPERSNPRETLIRLSDFISCRVLSCGCMWDEVRVTATRRRHADYRESHGFQRNQLMGDMNKTLRRAMKPLSFQVILRDEKRCLLCGAASHLEVHHCVPIHENRSRTADPLNLVTLCKRCHRGDAHAGNIRGPVDTSIAEHLHRLAALNEAACPTGFAIDLQAIQHQVQILFGYLENPSRLPPPEPKSVT